MIWKTTLAFLVAFIRNSKDFRTRNKLQLNPIFSILAFIGFSTIGYAQTCIISENGCPPTDITIECGSEVVNNVYGNYVDWSPPTYELNCGTGDGDAFQMSFDLPESGSDCWIFNKVQRVGTNNGTLNLWKSDGNASGTAEVTTPAFYVDGETSGSMTIIAAPGQSFTTNVFLVNSDGVKSGLMDSFVVNQSTTLYNYSVNPDLFEGTSSYRLKFEFTGGTNNASYVDLITFDANLFGNSCSGDVNFSVTSNYVPNDFFPVGSTEVVYTAICLGCNPVVTNTCSFNVIVNPIPATPVVLEIVQPSCEESLGSIEITPVNGMRYSIDGENFSTSTLFENLLPDTYYITAINSDNCESAPLEVVINVQPETPIAEIINNKGLDLSCNIPSTTLTASGGETYSWSNGSTVVGTSAALEVTAAGTYTVTVTNEDGCTATASVTVEKNITPSVAVITGNEILTCELTSLTLNAATSTADGTASYLWNDGSTEATLIVTAPGNYSVTVTGENGCSDEASVTVEQNIAPANAIITGNEILTCELTSITLDAGSSTADGTASYLWNDGSTEATLSVTAPGVYSVTVTGENGCSYEASVTVEQNITPANAVITGNDILTCDLTSVTLDASSSTADGDFTYLWSNGATTASINVTEAGTYTVTITGENGCSDETSVTVEKNDTTADAVITGNEILTCELTSITLNAGSSIADGTASYLWNDGSTEATLTVTAPGIYSVTVTGENGCSDEDSVTVEQNITPADAVITGNEILTCELTSITLNAGSSTADGTASYLWNDGSTEATLTVTAPGNYSVTVTGENGCSDEASVTVEQNITPADAVITGNEILTCDLTFVTLNAGSSTADGTASYLWNDGSTEATLTVTAPGVYSVTVTGENGCSDEASITVEQNITPANAVITGNDILTCDLTSITLDASSSTADGDFTYLWSNGATTASINVTEAGTYSVTITGENGCSDGTSVTVEKNDTTADAVITGNEILNCNTTSITLDSSTSTADGNFTYLWSDGSTGATLTVTAPGIYSVTVSGENGCSDTASVTVEQNITPADAVITGIDILTCELTSVTLNAGSSTADGTASYLWNDGSTEATLSVTAPGVYSVTVTGENGCSDEASVTVEQNITPANAVITGNDILTCDLTSVTLDASSSTADGDFTYLWSNGATTASINVTEAGTYTVTITGENGCSDETSVTVEKNDTTADAVITGNEILTCELTSITLNAGSSIADGTASYLWNDGSTEATLTVTAPGIYSVTVTGENGCSDEASVTVEQNITPADAVITGNEILTCELTSITLNAGSSTADGTASYLWNDGSTEATLTVTAPGNYSVTVTGENGCTATDSVTVEQNITPANAVITGNDILTCELTSVTLDASSSTADGDFTYLWSNGATTASINVTDAGTYSVTITGENGCSDEASVTVEKNDTTADAVLTGNEILNCNTTSITLDASTSTADGNFTYLWSDGSTGATLTVTEAGLYSVKITGENGCSDEASETVVFVPDTEDPEVDTLNDISVNVDSGNCSAIVEYTLPTATDNCSGAVVTLDEGSLPSGSAFPVGTTTVNYTATDASGNTTTVSFTVTVIDNEAPVADVPELPTVTGECSATVAVVPTATDNCGGTINGTTEDALTYTEQGTFTVTWTFDDGNGNITTQEQTVIVDDVTAPAAAVAELPTVTGECSATVSVVPTAIDNCGGTINGTTEDALTYTEQGTYTVTWTFNDGNGNTSTQTQTVIIDDVTAPVAVVAELPTVTGECAATVSVVPTATDNCGGTINGTTEDALTYTEQGTYTVTWTFNDGNGNTSTQTQTVIVDDVTAPVTNVAELPTVTGECSATVAVVPTATDNCGGTINGTTEDALTYTEQGTYTVTWTFNDGNGNTSTQTQTVIVDDVTAPVAVVAELPNVTGECSATVSVIPTATDNCGGTINGTTKDALTYTEQGTYTVTWTFNDGNGNTSTQTQTVIVDDVTAPVAVVAELPTVTGECSATVSVVPTATDNCGGTINGTTEDALIYTEQGTYTVTWTFNDGNGNTSTQTQTVIVDDVTAPVAVVAELPTVTGECSATVSVVPTATDNCGGTIKGTTEDALSYTEQGTYTVTWTFNDGNGNTSTQTQTVIVDDVTAPVADVAELPTVRGECSATVSAVPTATDNCGGTINGTTEDALTYTEQGTYTITWTFDDGNGNTSTQTQTVIVVNIDAPVVASVTQPNCDVATGSFSITAVDGLQYSLNGGAYAATTTFEGLSAGTYTVTASNTNGCVSAAVSVTINAAQNLAAPVIASTVQPDCTSATGSFTVVSQSGVSYSINGTDYQTAAQFTGLTPGSYNVTARNEAGCVSAATVVVIEEAEQNTPIQTDTVDICLTEEVPFDLNQLLVIEEVPAGTWEDPAQTGSLTGNTIDATKLAVGTYTFNYVIGGSCPSTTSVIVTINDRCVVLPCNPDDIKISKAVTPNGDGFNDFLMIDAEGSDLTCFTYNVKIFNRWGAEIFSAVNYRNNWDGFSNKSVTSSNQLPSGTYYYIVDVKDGNGGHIKSIQSYIYLGTK